jgi:hypothetical protein
MTNCGGQEYEERSLKLCKNPLFPVEVGVRMSLYQVSMIIR